MREAQFGTVSIQTPGGATNPSQVLQQSSNTRTSVRHLSLVTSAQYSWWSPYLSEEKIKHLNVQWNPRFTILVGIKCYRRAQVTLQTSILGSYYLTVVVELFIVKLFRITNKQQSQNIEFYEESLTDSPVDKYNWVFQILTGFLACEKQLVVLPKHTCS